MSYIPPLPRPSVRTTALSLAVAVLVPSAATMTWTLGSSAAYAVPASTTASTSGAPVASVAYAGSLSAPRTWTPKVVPASVPAKPAPEPTPSTTPTPTTTTPAPEPTPSTTPTPTTTTSAPSPSTTTPAPSPSTSTTTPTPSTSTSTTTAPAPTGGYQTPTGAGVNSSVAGRPDRSNTGVPVGTALRRVDGDITVRTSGTVLSNLDVHGFVFIKANNVTIKNSVVRGGVATGNTGLISATWGYTGLVVEDSTIYPEHPSVWQDGVKGGGFTLRRVNIWGTVDNVKVHGSNVRVENSYLHGTVKYASDPNQKGGASHNDAVQILGGDNITITGNTLVEADNSAIQVTQSFAPVTRSVISNNYANNGGCSFNVWISQDPSTRGLTVKDNRFGRTTRVSNCAIIANSASYLVLGSNVWDDDSSAVQIRKG